MPVKLSKKYLQNFIREDEYASISHQIAAAHTLLENRSGAGNDFLGWLDLPVNYDKEEFARIQAAAKRIRESCDVLVVIGIGGSYLGARAAIEFLNSPFTTSCASPARRKSCSAAITSAATISTTSSPCAATGISASTSSPSPAPRRSRRWRSATSATI